MTLFPWRRPRIPVIELHGLIAGRDGALNIRATGPLVERAFAAAKKGGVVILDIDSPGGSPVQSELIAGLVAPPGGGEGRAGPCRDRRGRGVRRLLAGLCG